MLPMGMVKSLPNSVLQFYVQLVYTSWVQIPGNTIIVVKMYNLNVLKVA